MCGVLLRIVWIIVFKRLNIRKDRLVCCFGFILFILFCDFFSNDCDVIKVEDDF